MINLIWELVRGNKKKWKYRDMNTHTHIRSHTTTIPLIFTYKYTHKNTYKHTYTRISSHTTAIPLIFTEKYTHT